MARIKKIKFPSTPETTWPALGHLTNSIVLIRYKPREDLNLLIIPSGDLSNYCMRIDSEGGIGRDRLKYYMENYEFCGFVTEKICITVE